MSRYQQVPVKDLIVDGRYQRPLDEKRVEKIAGGFNERLFGVLEVNRRNGKSAVFDGQHRLAAAKEIGKDKVPCMVHADLSPQEEALLFVELQRARKKVHPVDAFNARLFAGDEDAAAIAEIVGRYDYRIAARSGAEAGQRAVIGAVSALERVYARGNLDATLNLLAALWHGDEKSTEGHLISGLSLLDEGYSHRLDDEAMARLQAEPPVVVLRRAHGSVMTGGGGGRPQAVFRELRKIAGLRGAPRKVEEPVVA